MALVQMRTPGGSYSMVDAELVDDYEGQGWTRTSALSEFEGLGVVQYNADGTVLLESGETAAYIPGAGNESAGSGEGGGNQQQGTTTQKTYTFAQGLDTAKALYDFFEDDLLEEYARNWAKYGDANVAIGLTRKSKVWDKYFGYLKRDDGTLIMSEIDAMSNIYSFKSTLGEYGIDDTDIFQSQFQDLIVNGVNPIEFEERVATIYNEVIDDIPEVQRLYAEQYGIQADRTAIFGSLINKDVEDGLLANQIATLQIQAEATSRGFSTSFERAKSLRIRGLDRGTAKSLYEGAERTISRYKASGRDLSLSTLEEAALGDVRMIDRLKRYESEYTAKFGRQFGSARKDDEIVGLIAD